MSVSAISSTTNPYQTNLTSILNQRKQDFQNLASALQSGDLASAQKAFTQLQQDGSKVGQVQNSQNSSSSSAQNSPFQALASALQNGDLSGAQQALAQLQQGMKSHHHHHIQQAEPSQSSNTSQSTGTDLNGGSTTSTNGQISVTV